MKHGMTVKIGFGLILLAGLLFISPKNASAHCDTLDGPVVSAARKALQTNNPNLVLVWVKKEDEDELLAAFRKAMSRNDGDSENDFFEELVRIHRQGEGADYTGLKPAGLVEPVVAAADKALKDKDFTALSALIPEKSREAVHNTLHKAIVLGSYDPDNVDAGREFVASYVTYVHNVERAVNGEALIRDGENHHTHAAPVVDEKKSDSVWKGFGAAIVNWVRTMLSKFG